MVPAFPNLQFFLCLSFEMDRSHTVGSGMNRSFDVVAIVGKPDPPEYKVSLNKQ